MSNPAQAFQIVLSIASEALSEADEAVKQASAWESEAERLRQVLASSPAEKCASEQYLRTVHGHIKSAGFAVSEADLSTHEGALAALEKFASFHQRSIAALFDDPHGRPVKPPGAEGNAAKTSQGAENRYDGWEQAVKDVKKSKKR